MKFDFYNCFVYTKRLRPRGRSGLKSMRPGWMQIRIGSPSSRAEWVEIVLVRDLPLLSLSPSSRAEWVEIKIELSEILESNGLRPRGRSGLK